MIAILIYIGSGLLLGFTLFFKVFVSGENKKENEQNKIENKQLKEQIEGIQEWKRTNDHIDSLSPDDLASKLQAWSRAEKNDNK